MSKPVKQLILRDVDSRLGDASDVAVISLMGVGGVTNNKLRGELREKGIRVLVVKNSLANQVLRERGMERAKDLLSGPCAVAFGGESIVDVVRAMLEKAKQIPELQVKGALMEGEVFGPERVEELSKYPTRSEALGRVAGLGLSVGGKVVGAVTGPGAMIAGILKTIQEKQGGGEEAA